MSSRWVAVVVAISLVTGSTVFAEDSLLQSASKAVQAVQREQVAPPSARIEPTVKPLQSSARRSDSVASLAQQSEPTVAKSGMSTRTKVLIYVAIGAGFAGSALAIDRHVTDVTPSHLGTRQDGCKVFLFGC